MINADGLQGNDKNWTRQIDGETWQELTRLFERVVDTLGLIAPVLEIARGKSTQEKIRHLRAVTNLAYRGHRALITFSQRWALVQEENLKNSVTCDLEDFADIFQAARQTSIPNSTPNQKSAAAEETHEIAQGQAG